MRPLLGAATRASIVSLITVGFHPFSQIHKLLIRSCSVKTNHSSSAKRLLAFAAGFASCAVGSIHSCSSSHVITGRLLV